MTDSSTSSVTGRHDQAAQLMHAFAERTGLTGRQLPRRYLWTDAFAVCNFLGLAETTGDPRHRELARALVEQVHHVLGRHREDDVRRGWISGLPDAEGEAHPTRGGLRIGKPLPERAPLDERTEWDRDGQYFHYLTRWMHALDQATRHARDPRCNTWARELADTAHRAFTYRAGGQPRMAWKMSIDLTRALVPSMGLHDPLDGLLTCLQLRATAAGLPAAPVQPDLAPALADFTALCEGRDWTTSDPLGLGGLLMDAVRILQLRDDPLLADGALLGNVLRAAARGLPRFLAQRELDQPAERRLAFRELGLAIGLRGLQRMHECGEAATDPNAELAAFATHFPLAEAIEGFWRAPAHQRSHAWTGHRDINEVMLATCLAPEGMLVLARPGPHARMTDDAARFP